MIRLTKQQEQKLSSAIALYKKHTVKSHNPIVRRAWSIWAHDLLLRAVTDRYTADLKVIAASVSDVRLVVLPLEVHHKVLKLNPSN